MVKQIGVSDARDLGILDSAMAVLHLYSGEDQELKAAIATLNRKRFELLNKLVPEI